MVTIPAPTAPYFYPRSPCGERRQTRPCKKLRRLFLSTLSLRRATNYHFAGDFKAGISIHALLAESDGGYGCAYLYLIISIHALLAESDVGRSEGCWFPHGFLSTLSLWRATYGCYSLRHSAQFLSTLSLRRATLINGSFTMGPEEFLSTLSLRRATRWARSRRRPSADFYPRSPCGERLPHISIT